MNPTKSFLIFASIFMGLFVALYLGANHVKSESPLAPPATDEPVVAPVSKTEPPKTESTKAPKAAETPRALATATFASGCFWCTEAVFQRLKGVHAVVSGYSGGAVKNPTYRQVTTGTTGHAESIQVTYDPAVVSYPELLEIFWETHDPTTQDRQGNDFGPQYRSVIFYHTDAQKKLAEEYKKKLDGSGAFGAPIVTQIVPFAEFFPAEDYHQNYYNQHSQQAYCRAIIGPKLAKLKKVFASKLKDAPAQGATAPGHP